MYLTNDQYTVHVFDKENSYPLKSYFIKQEGPEGPGTLT